MANSFKIASKGQGTPLVFIHGWGLNSGVWQPCIEQLQQHYQVITVDLPGFGINVENKAEPYTIKNIVEIIQAEIPVPAVIIGWSLGGLVATELAYSFREKVTALITVASSPCFVEQPNWPGIKANVLKLFHQQLAEDTQKTINNFLKIQAMGSPHIRQDIKKIRDLVMQYPMPSKVTLERSLSFLEMIDQRQQLTEITQPSLRIYGKMDSLVPKAVINQVDELMPVSDKILFEHASHAPFISHFDEFIQSITNWLTQQGLN